MTRAAPLGGGRDDHLVLTDIRPQARAATPNFATSPMFQAPKNMAYGQRHRPGEGS